MLLLRLYLLSFLFFMGYQRPLFADPEAEMASRCLQDESKRESSGKLLAVMTTMPTPPVVPVEEPEGLRYLTSSSIFSRILGSPANAVILNESEELRFLPFTLSGTPVLLVIRAANNWNAQKAKKVASVAKLQGNSISLLWLNESPIPASLRLLAKETGGRAFGLRDLNRLVLRHVCSR
jgi:hypothetical protein